MMVMITADMPIAAGIVTIPVRQCRCRAAAGIITVVIDEQGTKDRSPAGFVVCMATKNRLPAGFAVCMAIKTAGDTARKWPDVPRCFHVPGTLSVYDVQMAKLLTRFTG